MEDRSSGLASRYGRACRNCAQAKVRCTWQEGSTCERCTRLKRICQVQDHPVRKRKAGNPTRVARLEQKLDGLVNLLSASRPPVSSDRASADKSPDPASTTAGGQLRDLALDSLPQDEQSVPTPPAKKPCTDLRFDGVDKNQAPQPASEPAAFDHPDHNSEAEFTLLFYAEHMAKHFPFVLVDNPPNPHDLYRHNPALYRAMITVATQPYLSKQRPVYKAMLQYITDHVVNLGERSLDLLQAILVLLSWYTANFAVNPQITNLLHLAMALVVDLGLNRPSRPMESNKLVMVPAIAARMGLLPSGPRTGEERRAVLGCFYINSVVSATFKRMESVRFSPYLEGCCKSLAAVREVPSDEMLVQLVRLQAISERISDMVPEEDDIDPTTQARAPIITYTKLFQAELKTFFASLPPKLQTDKWMLLHYHSVEIYLCETSLGDLNSLSSSNISLKYGILEILHNCLFACKSLFDVVKTFESSSFWSFPFPPLAQIAFCVTALAKILLADVEGWDLEAARKEVDLPSRLDELSEKFIQARKEIGINIDVEGGDLMFYFARRMRLVKTWYEAKISASSEAIKAVEDQARCSAMHADGPNTNKNKNPESTDNATQDVTNTPATPGASSAVAAVGAATAIANPVLNPGLGLYDVDEQFWENFMKDADSIYNNGDILMGPGMTGTGDMINFFGSRLG